MASFLMSASKYIKAQGLKDLQYVADAVGKHRDTINNWCHKEFALFEVVVAGVKAKETEIENSQLKMALARIVVIGFNMDSDEALGNAFEAIQDIAFEASGGKIG